MTGVLCGFEIGWEESMREMVETRRSDGERRASNTAALKQAKEGSLVRIKILPLDDQTTTEHWVSGYFLRLGAGLASFTQKDGRVSVYDLGKVEIELPLGSRVDVLPGFSAQEGRCNFTGT